jgi:transcription elongation factor GreA
MKPPVKRAPVVNLTQAGLDQAKFKLEQLTKQRAEVLVRLQAAREMGDLSENGAYKAARWELGGIDRELRKLNYLITYVKVIDAKHYKLEFNGKLVEYTLVSKHESDPSKGLISFESPLGQQLVGKKTGDSGTLNINDQHLPFKIISISS